MWGRRRWKSRKEQRKGVEQGSRAQLYSLELLKFRSAMAFLYVSSRPRAAVCLQGLSGFRQEWSPPFVGVAPRASSLTLSSTILSHARPSVPVLSCPVLSRGCTSIGVCTIVALHCAHATVPEKQIYSPATPSPLLQQERRGSGEKRGPAKPIAVLARRQPNRPDIMDGVAGGLGWPAGNGSAESARCCPGASTPPITRGIHRYPPCDGPFTHG
jgi:hypothetical protein